LSRLPRKTKSLSAISEGCNLLELSRSELPA
jgi:hypothetical protein